MASTNLTPEKITSPFQLMAAWFAMLVLLVSILLTAAINITNPEWAAGYLVIFSSVLTIIVIGCVTIMLTIFRPHLQEGKEYSQWLKDKNTYSSGLIRSEQISISSKSSKNKQNSIIFEKNRKNFLIHTTNAIGAHKLISALTESGFVAEVYKEPFASRDENRLDRHEAIWVGNELPTKEAIESIKIAVTNWPHLKYIRLSNDGGSPPDEIHRQMFFGGASSTAEKYGLQPWTNNELLDIDERISQEEFHRIIRNKYT